MKSNGRSAPDRWYRLRLEDNLAEYLELLPSNHLVITSTLLTKHCSRHLPFQILLWVLLMSRLRRVVLPYNSSLAHLLLRTQRKSLTSSMSETNSSTILLMDGQSLTKI